MHVYQILHKLPIALFSRIFDVYKIGRLFVLHRNTFLHDFLISFLKNRAKIPILKNLRVRPKSAIGARSARSAVCSKLPSNRKIACRYVTALIGPDQKVPLVVNPDSLQMALFGLE